MSDDFVDTATDSWTKVESSAGTAADNGTFSVSRIEPDDVIAFKRKATEPVAGEKPSAVFSRQDSSFKWTLAVSEFIWKRSSDGDKDFGVVEG